MSESTDCSALQAALQDLNNFLGQTYITVCQEVARAEYAVQADMRVLKDLESQTISNQHETQATQQEEPSSASAKLRDKQTRLGGCPTTVTSELPTAGLAVPQHDKLQAVLAQARAIRRQGKTQAANRSHLSTIQPAVTSRRAPGPVSQSTELNTSSCSHDRRTMCHTVTANTGSKDSSRYGHSACPANRSQLPNAQRPRQQLPEQLLPVEPLASGKGTETKPSLTAQPGTDNEASRRSVQLQLPADFREALNALRQPGIHQPTCSAASSGRTTPASSHLPFIDLEDTYNECMASISEAGAAFKHALCPDKVQAAASTEVLQSWADLDSQNWLRHSALVEAQVLLMQRLSSQLQAHPGGQAGGSSASVEQQWQEILQLWQEVAVLLHSVPHVLHHQWHN
ncbi:hypothetical protein ABBQ32_004198 [Trebouxia sp. C0010 RCD-2024]